MRENEIIDDWMQKIAARSRDSFVQARTQGRNIPRKIVQAAGRFALVESDGSSPELSRAHETHLPVVMLRLKAPPSRKFWPGTFDAEDVKPPVCYSFDDIRPERDAPEPQSDFCQSCEQNIWAVSPDTGRRTPPRCRKQKTLAVFIPGQLGAWQLNIGPGSWAAWDQYVDEIENRSNDNLTLFTVVTEISFNRDPKKPNTLLFTPAGYINNEKLVDADDRVEYNRIAGDENTLARLLWGSLEREREFFEAPQVERPRIAPVIAVKALPVTKTTATKSTEELINDTIPDPVATATEVALAPTPARKTARPRRPEPQQTVVDSPLSNKPPPAEGTKRFQELKKYFEIGEIK